MQAKLSRKALVWWAIVLLSFILTISLLRSLYENWKKGDYVRVRQEELERLERENLRLKQALEYAKTPEFVEKEARDKLGLAKSGEVIVILSQPQATPSSQSALGTVRPSWKLWWRLFF